MFTVPDHMIDCSNEPDMETLKRISSGDYSHVQTDSERNQSTSKSSTLAVITGDDCVLTADLDPSKSEDIDSISGKTRLRPDIGGLVVLRSSAVGPEVEDVELPD